MVQVRVCTYNSVRRVLCSAGIVPVKLLPMTSLRVHVCVCVCVCVCVRACMRMLCVRDMWASVTSHYTHIDAYTHTHTHTHSHNQTHTHTHTGKQTRTRTQIFHT